MCLCPSENKIATSFNICFYKKVISSGKERDNAALSYAFAESEAKSEEEMMAEAKQMFTDLLKRDYNEIKTSAIDIKLSRHENSWKIDANDEFKNAVLGGLVSASGEIANSFGGSDSS